MMTTEPVTRPTSWGDRLGGILHYDFCPFANRWVCWLKKPVASLSVAAVVSLGCAIFVKPVAVVGFVGVVLTLVLGYFSPAISVRRLRAELAFDESRVREGEPVRAVLRVTSRWPWPIFGLTLEEGFFHAIPAEGAASEVDSPLSLEQVPGWATTEFRWSFTPTRRGVYPFRVPRLVTGFPFGLTRASRPVETSVALRVWPATFPLDTLLDSSENVRHDDLLCEHRVGECGDLLGTRPFRNGDALRRVHWAQTARHGQLIVCERQGTTQASIRIVVDTDSASHSRPHAQGSLEWSLRLAATLCEAYHAQHARVECVLGSQELVVESGEAGLRRFLDRLAEWAPEEADGAVTPVRRTRPAPRRDLMQLHLTTDDGLIRREGLRHPREATRCIVLKRSAFEPVSASDRVHQPGDEPVALCPMHSWVVVDHPSSAVTQFRSQWRRMCREG